MEGKRDFVVVFCQGRHNRILIVNKDRPEWQKGRINLPGGKIEPEDANPVAAALRELKEESGLDPIIDLHSGPRARQIGLVQANGFKIHIISVGVRENQPIVPRPGETETVEWVSW